MTIAPDITRTFAHAPSSQSGETSNMKTSMRLNKKSYRTLRDSGAWLQEITM